jgi:hypothetical protein
LFVFHPKNLEIKKLGQYRLPIVTADPAIATIGVLEP